MAECFNEKCKRCSTEMEQLHEDGSNKFGNDYIFWCPKCGAIVSFYACANHFIPSDDEWKYPMLINVKGN